MATITTATATGSAWKQVTCEGCGHKFEYLIKRSASESRDSRGLLSSDRNDVADVAKYGLQYKLKHETDLIPCPACGVYQAEMISTPEIRPMWLVILLVVVVVVLLAVLDVLLKNVSIPVGPVLIAALVVGGIAYIPLRKLSAVLTDTIYQYEYSRRNANVERNKKVAADLEKKGRMRSQPVPGC